MSDSGEADEGAAAAPDGKSDSKKKIIRLLTVVAYVSSVSGAAFMLSMYYLFLWEPKVAEHHLRADPNQLPAPLALRDHGEYRGAAPGPGGYPQDYHPGYEAGYHDGNQGLFPRREGYFQSQPPYLVHVPPQPPPRLPPVLSQVKDSLLLDRIGRVALSSLSTSSTSTVPTSSSSPTHIELPVVVESATPKESSTPGSTGPRGNTLFTMSPLPLLSRSTAPPVVTSAPPDAASTTGTMAASAPSTTADDEDIVIVTASASSSLA